jgi:excisionase family DNA binding protein
MAAPVIQPIDSDGLMTAKQAAAMLAISARSLWSMTNARAIPCVRLGRSVRYRRGALVDWINQNETGGAR